VGEVEAAAAPQAVRNGLRVPGEGRNTRARSDQLNFFSTERTCVQPTDTRETLSMGYLVLTMTTRVRPERAAQDDRAR
jgi:hypothetical protein